MQIDVKNLISLSEANQNFSKVARMVEASGSAIILKNNAPKFVIFDYGRFEEIQISDEERLEKIAARIMEENAEAFKELAM